MQESIETSKGEPGFVEIGYICRLHGLQGEVRVKPNTDFPELRFSKPGRRWLRQEVSGRETIQELELLAEKLAEEDAERKVKGEAKKEKLLVGGKGHVKPANFLDSHEKFLIGVATKSSDQAI